MNRLAECKPGDTVYIVERDGNDRSIYVSGYMFLAACAHTVIVSTFFCNVKDLAETLDRHIEATIMNYGTDLSVFAASDCYSALAAAEAALEAEA